MNRITKTIILSVFFLIPASSFPMESQVSSSGLGSQAWEFVKEHPYITGTVCAVFGLYFGLSRACKSVMKSVEQSKRNRDLIKVIRHVRVEDLPEGLVPGLEALIAQGADVNFKDQWGNTPADWIEKEIYNAKEWKEWLQPSFYPENKETRYYEQAEYEAALALLEQHGGRKTTVVLPCKS